MWVWWLTPQMVVWRWWQYFLNGYVKYGTMQVCDGPNGGGSKMGLWNWIVRYRGVEGFLWEYTMFPPPTMAIFGLIKLEMDLWTSSLVEVWMIAWLYLDQVEMENGGKLYTPWLYGRKSHTFPYSNSITSLELKGHYHEQTYNNNNKDFRLELKSHDYGWNQIGNQDICPQFDLCGFKFTWICGPFTIEWIT